MFIVYIMVAWFLILSFGDKNYFLCSIIILVASVVNILMVDVFGLTDSMGYIELRGLSIKIDGLAAVILTAFYTKDKLAFKMSLLLAFSVLCHTMIVYNLTVHSGFVSNFFYAWYDELIITIGILQMWISRNGIITVLRNKRGNILWISFYSWCHSKSLCTRKRSEAKT